MSDNGEDHGAGSTTMDASDGSPELGRSDELSKFDERDELAELRLRVAAQDRLIAAMLDENESIHQIRRNNSELARVYNAMRQSRHFDKVLVVRSRVLTKLGRR